MERCRRYLPALIFLLALTARLLPGARTIDDSFITFRYARNLLSGAGFVFNPGEHVLGTTTPLYTLLMAGLGALFGGTRAPFPHLALGVNALADSLTCLLLIRLGKDLGAPRSGYAAALAWSVAPWSVTFAIGGLETSLYVLLLTAAALAWARERPARAALWGALALLTRPDALILLLPLGADYLLRLRRTRQRPSLRPFLLPALLLAAWFGFAALYFGSPIPHSISAKSLAYRLGPTEALVRLIQHYATPFLLYTRLGMGWVAAGMVLYPFLFLVGARRAVRRNPRLRPWLLYPWLYFALFAAANPLIFRWYLTPPLPPYIFGILLGMETLLAGAPTPAGKSAPRTGLRRLRQAGIALGMFLLPWLAPLSTWTLHPDHGLDRPAPEMAWYQLELLYHQAADFLRPRLTADATLAAGDVGVLGYDTGARILDLVGLNSPQTSAYFPLPQEMYAINYAVPPQLIFDTRPQFIVILEVYGRNGLLKDPRLWESYTLLRTFETDIYGSQGMLVFARK